MSIAIKNHKIFVDKLLSRYLEHGFGTLTKREIDILMMHLIIEHSDLHETSNHELSIMFKITESKIKNLRYEAKLKHVEDQESYVKDEFLKLLQKSKFEVDKKRIIFSVEDTYLKSAIQGKLKQFGSFADNSFNSELVKISEDSFIELLESFYSQKERKAFEKKAQKLLKEEDAISFKSITKKFLDGVAESAGGKVVDIGVGYFGGIEMTNYQKFLNKILNYFT